MREEIDPYRRRLRILSFLEEKKRWDSVRSGLLLLLVPSHHTCNNQQSLPFPPFQ